MKYFSFNAEDGFQLHETAEEASKFAEEALEYERGEAQEGWSDDVGEICWGELRQKVVETFNRPRTDEDMVSPTIDTISDYGLIDVV